MCFILILGAIFVLCITIAGLISFYRNNYTDKTEMIWDCIVLMLGSSTATAFILLSIMFE